MREGVVKEERDEHAHILVDTDTGYDAPKAVSVTSPRSNRTRTVFALEIPETGMECTIVC